MSRFTVRKKKGQLYEVSQLHLGKLWQCFTYRRKVLVNSFDPPLGEKHGCLCWPTSSRMVRVRVRLGWRVGGGPDSSLCTSRSRLDN